MTLDSSGCRVSSLFRARTTLARRSETSVSCRVVRLRLDLYSSNAALTVLATTASPLVPLVPLAFRDHLLGALADVLCKGPANINLVVGELALTVAADIALVVLAHDQ